MPEQIDNVSREVEILKKNKKEMVDITSTVTEMKNAFDWLSGRLDIDKKIITELEDMSIEYSTTN